MLQTGLYRLFRSCINAGLTKEPGHLQGLTATSSIFLTQAGFTFINCSHTFDSDS